MRKPEYITQINIFYDWCTVHHLPPLAKLLWYMLMQLDNLSGWPEWFEASTTRLTMLLDSSRPTLIKNRQALEEAGLIEYKPGNKGQPGLYKMNFLARDKNGVPVPLKSPASNPYTKAFTQKETKNNSMNGESNKENNVARTDGANKEKESNSFTQSFTENKIVSSDLTESFTESGDVSNGFTENKGDSEKVSSIVSSIVSSNPSSDLTESFTENDSLLYINNKTEKETETETTHARVSGKKENISYSELMEFYNDHHGDMPTVKVMTDARKAAVRRIVNKHSCQTLKEVILKAEKSDFMNGRAGGRGWKANFDWILKPANFVKILEGNYDNRANAGRPQNAGASGDYLWNLSMFGDGTGGENDKAGNRTDTDDGKNQLPGVSFEVE